MVETAWQALCAKLGELPANCKSLNHQELQFLVDSLESAERQREQALQAAVTHTLRHAPGFVHNIARKLFFR